MKIPVNPVIIGKIVGVYGVLGWIKVQSFTKKIDKIFNYVPWFVFCKSRWRLLQLESWKFNGKLYIVKIVDFTNREFAKLFVQCSIMIDRTQLPILRSGEYYWRDIIGCQLITIKQKTLGYVFSITETPVYDLLIIKANQNCFYKTKHYLIPFIQNKIIKKIDLISNIIIVDWYI